MQKLDTNSTPIERFSGCVAHGDKLGRTLGFPTANLVLEKPAQSANGVYISALRVGCQDGPDQVFFGLSALGCRPTVAGQDLRLETFIPDFVGDLYDQEIQISLLTFIRGEERFESLEDLVTAMNADLAAFRDHQAQALRDLSPADFLKPDAARQTQTSH